MKFLSYIFIFVLTLMCSQSSAFYNTLDCEINGDSLYDKSALLNVKEDSKFILKPNQETSQKIIKSADLRFQNQYLNQIIKTSKGFIQDWAVFVY